MNFHEAIFSDLMTETDIENFLILFSGLKPRKSWLRLFFYRDFVHSHFYHGDKKVSRSLMLLGRRIMSVIFRNDGLKLKEGAWKNRGYGSFTIKMGRKITGEYIKTGYKRNYECVGQKDNINY